MENIEVIKRDGTREELNYDKIHKVLLWATENITGVSVSEIELKAKLNIYDGIPTTDIHETLINTARDLITEDTPNYDRVAGRLVIFGIRKEVYGDFTPCDLYTLMKRNIELGFYDPELLKEFTKEEIDELDDYIVHDRDYNFRFAGTQQLVTKYLTQDRTTGKHFESPQMMYMLIAMTLFMYDYEGSTVIKSRHTPRQRLKIIKEFYDDVSLFKTGLPTPILAGCRTPTRQYSSCVVIETDDNLDSIGHTNVAIMRYISKKAGLGLNFGRVRPEGSAVGNGEVKHTGLVPFIKAARGAVKSCCLRPDMYVEVLGGKITIEDVRPGMEIKTRDVETGEIIFKEVTDHFVTEVPPEDQVSLGFRNGVTLECSINHPIMVMEDGVIIEVKPNDLTDDMDVITDQGFTKLESFERGGDNDTKYYDITVEDTHTFFASESEDTEMVLTHNSQGGLRGGSATMHFPLWHTDIESLLVLKNNKGTEETRERHLDYSVGISGYFLDRLIKGKNITLLPPNLEGLYDAYYEDSKKFRELYEHYEKSDEVPAKLKKTISASKLFGSLLTEGKNTGRVYIHVVDEINRHTPFDRTTDPIRQSNLCVAGNTKILTRDGEKVISELAGTSVEVWNGEKWSLSDIFQTGVDQELIEVEVVTVFDGRFEAINTLQCTHYHKWIDKDGNELRTHQLEAGMNLLPWTTPEGVKVNSVIARLRTAERGDTYCFTEPERNMGVFNGILTSQCQEIALPTRPFYSTEDEDGRIALCTLANSNWGEFSSPQTMRHPLRRIVRGLDNILTMQEYPMVQARRATEEFRPLGIGVNNLAYFLAKNNTSYSDAKALPLVHTWMEHMAYYMQEATIELAKERGPCERSEFTKRAKGVMLVDTYKKAVDRIVANDLELDWDVLREGAKKYGVRNATLSATMPSESNSQVMNCMAFDTVIQTNSGRMTFKEFVESQGLDYEEVLKTGGDTWYDVDEGITVKNMNGEDEAVTGLYYNGDVVVDEIELEDGTVLKCTPEHRFLVHRDGEKVWVKVKDLVEGDDIVEVK